MKENKALHYLAIALAFSTLFLIFAGGLVNSMGAGLSVPDWPLSYGQIMPPMVGGVFYEHGHRMIATGVGFLTVLFASFVSFTEDRAWIKKAAWIAVGLVILQGVLGGLTVLFLLPPPISIAHATLAQTFFCLTIGLAIWTSPFWRKTSLVRQENSESIPLHRLGMALLATCFIQLILGATLRHTGRALAFHILGAFTVAIFACWFVWRVWRNYGEFGALRRVAALLLVVLISQLGLGVATYFLLRHRFDVIPPPFPAILTITAHVAIGALLLGLSMLAILLAYRTKPAHLPSLMTTLKDYFTLTKPGIGFMAGFTALAGFILGSPGEVNFLRLIHTCLGTLLAAAGAGCLNMLIEKDIDAQMARTQSRPLPSGRLKSGEVFFIGLLFSLSSVVYLSWMVNFITAFFGALTLSVYLYFYTPLKKISGVCVSIGAIAGALPPVMGWTAATGRLSIEALALFGILFFWQFPHFLSLAWLYKEDYASAGLHMLPNPLSGDRATALQMFWSSAALMLVSFLPTFLGLTGRLYFLIALSLGVVLLWFSYGFLKDIGRPQARRVFLFSLLYIPVLVTFMLINTPGKGLQ
ncbi:MAG: Protoheme IX farnesyltransferase [Elusimicrobia bacterium]|nr:Protoheme IX farnesyltransferase [Elusimicrobiota bacterium]